MKKILWFTFLPLLLLLAIINGAFDGIKNLYKIFKNDINE